MVRQPAGALDQLDDWYRQRTPSVVVLEVPFGELKEPQTWGGDVFELDGSFEFSRERLHFLTWVNRYDGRDGELRWHHAGRARSLGAEPGGETGDVAVDGKTFWVDGGPRTPLHDLAVIHVEAVWSGSLLADTYRPPSADLADDQMAAVVHPGGPARIIAPAGSGKTRVLTEHLRHLVVDRGWNPDCVTALAYNRRAAGEMTQRVDRGHIRTLHAFGYEILGRARGRRPRLAEEREIRRILDRLAPVRPRANEDVHAPYLEGLNEIRTALRSPADVEAERDDAPGLTGLFGAYRQALSEAGSIDHDEQIYGAIEALLADADLRSWAQSRCRHLLVDEFQDLTTAHVLLVRLLSAPGYDVFGVGDDDQVIYGYAGADPGYLIDYSSFFPSPTTYHLEYNYRCAPDVVGAASNLLSHNRRRIDKTIRSASTARGGLETIQAAEYDLGERLVEMVRAKCEESGPDSVAVLARVNVGLLVPQLALGESGISTDQPIGETLLARSGVRTALAWLRLGSSVAHSEAMDGADLAEAVRRPPRSLSPGVRKAVGSGTWTIERLGSFAEGSNEARTRQRLTELVEDLVALAGLNLEGAGVAHQLTFVRDRIGLGNALDRLDNSRARPTGGHTDDLDSLIVLAHTHPEIEAFEPWLRSRLTPSPTTQPAVTLSTIHRVKGLEWPHVAVWDASLGLMPHRLATDIEEERRIFHVAVTRSSATTTVISRAGAASPFVGQLSRVAEPEPTTPRQSGRSVSAHSGLELTWQGFDVRLVETGPDAAVAAVGNASRVRIRYGESVTHKGRRATLAAPKLEIDPAVIERLKQWRRNRSEADGVPAFVIAHDAHLESIASRRPQSLEELGECGGIGATKLERYGEEILSVLNPAS